MEAVEGGEGLEIGVLHGPVDDKSFDVELQPGRQSQTLLKRPGVYTLFGKYHPGMKGRLVIMK